MISNVWMVFAVMIIAYIGLGIAGRVVYTPSYTSSTIVAVYPFNKMYTLEASSYALETVSAANEVFNSEMFSAGLEERLKEPADFSLHSQHIDRTYILMLSVYSPSPEDAYHILQAALDYYGEISSHLVGDNHLEILYEPDFPIEASNESRILKYRPLLTLFLGFAMGCFLILMYAMRKTYKTASAVRRNYNDVRFFTVRTSASAKRNHKNKRKSSRVPNKEAMRKTALELLQTIRAKNDRSILVTSAAQNEGKTRIAFSLAREMSNLGKSVIVVETDPGTGKTSERTDISDDRPDYTLSSVFQDGVDLESIAVDGPGKKVKVIFANSISAQEEFHYTVQDVENLIARAEKLADVILVDGRIWNGSRDELIWRKAADATLAVCGQDKADFYAIDHMMTDLREDDPEFLGCVLYGF